MAETQAFSKRLIKALRLATIVAVPVLLGLTLYNYTLSGQFGTTAVTSMILAIFCLLFVFYSKGSKK